MFSDYAQYYDLLNQHKDYVREVNYIISLINRYKQSPQTVLELGCGTGLHAIQFAKKGFPIYGIDQSTDMINKALERKNNLPDSISTLIKFTVGDIRSYSAEKQFDVVISLFHVMSYQISNDDLRQSFNTAQKHLKTGGVFIFDCWYGPAVLSEKPYKRSKKFEDVNITVNRTATPHFHPTRNQVDVHFDIAISNKQSRTTENIKEIHKMRYLFNPEIELLLGENNLKIVHSEEWLTGNKPDFNSWYVTFICQRV